MKVSSHTWRLVFLLLSPFTSVVVLLMVVFAQKAHAAAHSPVPLCTAREIKADVSEETDMHRPWISIYYTNISSSPCFLFGWPIIQLEDTSGFLYETEIDNRYDIGYENPESLKPIVLPPNKKESAATVFTFGGCLQVPKQVAKRVGFFITLPHDTTPIAGPPNNATPFSEADLRGVRQCDNSDNSGIITIAVGAFREVKE